MRLALLALAASSLALAGCGKKETAGNGNAVDQQVTAEDFATNDTTAIDAATGADANMAADVEINLPDNATDGSSGNRIGNGTRSGSTSQKPASSKSRESTPGNSTTAPAPEPLQPTDQPSETNRG